MQPKRLEYSNRPFLIFIRAGAYVEYEEKGSSTHIIIQSQCTDRCVRVRIYKLDRGSTAVVPRCTCRCCLISSVEDVWIALTRLQHWYPGTHVLHPGYRGRIDVLLPLRRLDGLPSSPCGEERRPSSTYRLRDRQGRAGAGLDAWLRLRKRFVGICAQACRYRHGAL